MCLLDVAQPFATVRNRLREAHVAEPMASSATWSLLEISDVAASFRVAGVALCDVSACFLTCPKSFCVAGAILLQRFQKMRCIFRGSHSTLETSSVMLCGSRSTSVVSRSHFTLHTLHSTLHTTPHSTLYTPHSILYTPHSTLYTLHFTIHTPRSALYTLHSTLHTLHFTLYTLYSILYTPQFKLYTPHTTLYTPHSTLCIPPSTASHNLQCTGMVAGETCTKLSNYSFHKSVLRDCIRVRGLHLVFSIFLQSWCLEGRRGIEKVIFVCRKSFFLFFRAGALEGVGIEKVIFACRQSFFSIFLQSWCLGRVGGLKQ